jgi:hypothetical protein
MNNDAASTTSEDSQEPYYHIETGKIVKARDAWEILAAENHPRYAPAAAAAATANRQRQLQNTSKPVPLVEPQKSTLVGHVDDNSNGDTDSKKTRNDSIFRSSDGEIISSEEFDDYLSMRGRIHRGGENSTATTSHQDYSSSSDESSNIKSHHHHIRQDSSSSFSADPTQSSIDRALHNPESPTASISPYKDMKQIYKNPASSMLVSKSPLSSPYEDGHNTNSSHNSNPYITSNSGVEVPPCINDNEESDPIILRATAMAMAAQNGLKLTPEQMALIAQPDVQQQKLIEEAKRVQKAKEMQFLQQQQQQVNLQTLGADIKKFILNEKEKPPMQWGADFGKFIESQIMVQHHHGHSGSATSTTVINGEETSSAISCRPSPSPPKKKMEGFGCDPSISSIPSSETSSSSLLGGKGLVWPSMNIPTPSLPMLNESIITNILPGGGGGGISNRPESGSSSSAAENMQTLSSTTTNTAPSDAMDINNDPVIFSTILWKRKSVGKRNTIMLGSSSSSSSSSWEKGRVELRGSKLLYYRSSSAPIAVSSDGKEKTDNDDNNIGNTSGGLLVTVTPIRSTSENSTSSHTPNVDSTTKRLSVLFQAAEQKIQTAKEEFNRLASSATGLERKSSSSTDSTTTPLGVMDLVKENAIVAASMGHSGAPTPFCLSIKIKSETKWKFAFDKHSDMMECLAAMTDVIVKSSVDANDARSFQMEMYCIQRSGGLNIRKHGDKNVPPSTSPYSFFSAAVVAGDKETKWIVWGTLACVNIAFLLARVSDLGFWKLLCFLNFGLWQLRRLSLQAVIGREAKMGNTLLSPTDAGSDRKWSYKPTAGSTTIKVTKEDDPNTTEKGHSLPSWVPISSSSLEVRSHGYLTTKRKIPSPGELYECVAVDCFVSNARVPEIATRMKFEQQFETNVTGRTWKSPDIFVVSLAIPTEAPKLGYSTDDGPGATIVGYFKMKEETRTILRRITAAGYDSSTDTAEAEIDVQKRLTNGVRLWEKYCQEAPTDPSFQARFKLIPSANLEEMGCPSYIAKYNGKPVLIKRKNVTGFFNDYPALNACEFDVSLHPFPYLFKQGMSYMKEYFDRSVWTLGFVIEGRNNDELPEVVIGAMKVCHPNPKYTVNGEELFSGTCSKVIP